jgi:acyl-[acyl-carrier-protein]-phospholipid O-acyltransferase/long-chain-fatty-acid--[acyl-carrier-protein] ligase
MEAAHRTTSLSSPRFTAFLAAQFLGAANDNAYRFTLTLFVLSRVADEAAQLRYTGLAAMLFPLPFLIFYPLAGYLADRFRKSRIAVATKTPELAAMGLAVVGFQTGSLPLLMVALFLMATQSAFFSPVKYGLLPESVAPARLSMANGVLQMTTNLAILVGAGSGMLVFDRFKETPERIGWVYLGVAALGTAATLYLPPTPPGDRAARLEPVAGTRRDLQVVRESRVLVHTVLGIAYFGFLGSIFLAVVPVYGKSVLGLTELQSGGLVGAMSIGIAAGSLLAGKLSRGRVEVGLVPLGSIGFTIFSLDMALFGNGGPTLVFGLPLRATVDLLLLGMATGLYIVPLNAQLQQRAPRGMKGRVIAFSNVATFAAVALAAAVVLVGNDLLGLGVGQLLLAVAITTVGVTAYILALVPDYFVRLVLWIMTTTVYRLEVEGEHNVPPGGALLVANHVSMADALLVGSATDRMIRFLMYRPYFELRGLSWLFRRMHAIPVAGGDSSESKERALDAARGAVAEGHVVCIFAEGAITRTGNLLPFKRGFERVAADAAVPVVPVLLDGVWGSLLSWERGKLLFKWPRRLRAPVRVIFGEPLPPIASAHEVRRQIQQLSVRAFELRRARLRPLAASFLRTARRVPGRTLCSDGSGRRLTVGGALTRAVALKRRLLDGAGGSGEPVGLLLPTGITGMVAHLAVLCADKVPAHLGVGSTAPEIVRRCRAAGVGRVLLTAGGAPQSTVRALRDAGIETLDAERAEASLPAAGLRALRLQLALLPGRLLERRLLDGPSGASGAPGDVERTAAIVFSTPPQAQGEVRAVALSHSNLLSNLESLKQVFRVSRHDRLLGVLPFANAFGLAGTLLLPALAGVHVVYHDDPFDAETVERLCRAHRVTLLPVAPAHLRAYVERTSNRAFLDLRHAVTAGEPLTAELREAFRERYAVEPLEGFGCPECAPLISLNVPTVVLGRERQVGNRPGTSGHPLPGLAVRIVDGDGGAVLPPGDDGLLLVQGPNVMQGYLDDPELTRRVLRDGWYHTGFLAREDRDGFITVLGPGADEGAA